VNGAGKGLFNAGYRKQSGGQSCTGMSLLETLVAMLVLAISMSGSLELLRLTDASARHACMDNRITELLREYSDFVLYVAYDQLPTDGAVLGEGNLYQIYDIKSKTAKGRYSYSVTANVSTFNPGTLSEYKEINLLMDYETDKNGYPSQLVNCSMCLVL
jgi:Tfp pilus assembly protein PilV